MLWAAVLIIVCQVIIMGMLAWYIRTFGAYADAVLKAHQSNAVLYQQSLKVLEYANELLAKEAAA